MKFFLIIFILFISILFSIKVQAETDWTKYTPVPCVDIDSSEWNGPIEYTLCGYESDLIDCDSCCYKIIYYDNWNNQGGGSTYNINVVGIFWEGDSCDICNKIDILDAFYRKMMLEKTSDTNFTNNYKIMGVMPPEVIQTVATPGKCLDSIDYLSDIVTPCTNDNPCCETKYHLYLDTLGHLDSLNFILGSNNEPEKDLYLGASCTMSDCSPFCNLYPFVDIQDTLPQWPDTLDYCSVNCGGVYVNRDTTIYDYAGCQGCTLTFHFRTRQTINCQPQNYFEIILDEVKTSGCEYCNLKGDELFIRFLDVVLKQYGNEKVIPPACDTNVRVAHASCWGFFDEYPWVIDSVINGIEYGHWDSTHTEYVYKPCPVDTCCWAVFVVCNHGSYVTYDYYNGSSVDITNCQFNPYPCDFVCGAYEPPTIKIPTNIRENFYKGFKFETYPVPNPNNGNMNIILKSKFNGILHLKIYDMNGIEINSLPINKNLSQISIPINMQKNNSGVYFYKIFIQNKMIIENKFSIVK